MNTMWNGVPVYVVPPQKEKILVQILESTAYREAEGIQVVLPIAFFVRDLRAPLLHSFAAGIKGISRKDLDKAVKDDKSVLDKAFGDCTPIDLAIACNNVQGLKDLLQMGADPNNKSGIACGAKSENEFDGKEHSNLSSTHSILSEIYNKN